jgi:hypothetical protein
MKVLHTSAGQSPEVESRDEPVDDLDAFVTEHRRCGELDGGVDGATIWLAWECGAGVARAVVTKAPLT